MPPADPNNDICEKTGRAGSGEINRKKVLGTTEEDKMADEVDFSRKG